MRPPHQVRTVGFRSNGLDLLPPVPGARSIGSWITIGRSCSSPLDLNQSAHIARAVRNLNSSRKIAADGSPSNGGVSLCGSDHLCDRWISDPTIPVECQPGHPYSIQRCEGGAGDLWFDSALSFAPGPNRFPLTYWWPLAHPLVIFSPAPRACSCARAGQRGKQCPVPSAWSFLAFFCNAFNAHRVAAPEVFPVSPFTCLSHSWQQRGPVSFPVCARCYSAFLSS